MIPILTDEMTLSSTMNVRLKVYEFEVDEEDKKMFEHSEDNK